MLNQVYFMNGFHALQKLSVSFLKLFFFFFVTDEIRTLSLLFLICRILLSGKYSNSGVMHLLTSIRSFYVIMQVTDPE